MAAIITRKVVEAAFRLFCEVVPPPKGERWVLESNNPGDGRRYGLYTAKAETKGEFGYSQPMGFANWRSGREAVDGLNSMRAAANYLSRQAQEK